MLEDGDKNSLYNNQLPGYTYESPFLPQNNTTVVPSNDAYIYFNVEKPVRGRFEHSFFETGIAILTASGLGAFRGFLQGKQAALSHPPKLRRIVLINHVVKRSKLGNMVGVLATVYAATGIALATHRNKEDAGNTIAAAAVTGLAYTLPGKWSNRF
ncbi:mitochondrial import inner membrane translocase subunit Tim23 isoform X2 [Halyomorpha halys]|uniref:mitochondrial import inner membrane translocase subunit Tim23 isoform X2 n=1 Tax=Halyomorpha halys TaxID=286706 RepID=UPI0034D22D49